MTNPKLIQYYESLWTPTKIFTNRHVLNVFQIIVVFIFWIGCLMFPITLQTAQLQTVSLDTFAPNSLSAITDEVAPHLQQAKVQNDELIGQPFQTTQVAGWLANKEDYLNQLDRGFYFDTVGFYIKTSKEVTTRVPYSQPLNPSDLSTAQAVKDFVSKQWFVANKGFAVSYILLTTAILISTNVLLILLGSAFFLWLTRKSTLFTIKTYKESLNIVLNAIGIPTIVSTVLLFRGLDIPTTLYIHGLLTVIMIAATFYITHYNDDYVMARQKMKAKKEKAKVKH